MIMKHADDRTKCLEDLERLGEMFPHCRTKAQSQIRNIKRGVQGEKEAAHFLNRDIGDDPFIILLHDLRIKLAPGEYMQIDHLILHLRQRAAWVFETKNYNGNMVCNEWGEWCVFYGRGRPIQIQSPVQQAKRHVNGLKQWFKDNHIDLIKRFEPIVMVSPSSSINRKNLSAEDHVIKSDNLEQWRQRNFENIGAASLILTMSNNWISGRSTDEIKLIGKRLELAHEPEKRNWRQFLGIKDDMVPRVSTLEKMQKIDAGSPIRVNSGSSRNAEFPDTISTPHGLITIRQVGDEYAIKNPYNGDVIEAMKKACRGRGRWHGYYKNWLVPRENMESVIADLQAAFR